MILVTGGAGFIGSHLVESLLGQGAEVRVLDNLSTGKKENLEELSGHRLKISSRWRGSRFFRLGKNFEFLLGDITDREACRRACEGVEYVLHEAALGSVQRSVEDPICTHEANATGTLNILQAAREAGVRRIVYASSSSVYGNSAPQKDTVAPKKESLPLSPQSPYAATKLAGEIYLRIFSQIYSLETVSLRYFNVFGPRQDPHSIYSAVIPRFISALRKGEPPVIYGDGEQSRDFTYVENVVLANLLALKRPGISGQVFNIACGGQTSVNDLFARLQEISGRNISSRHEKPREGEVRHSTADIRLAKQRLGYEIKVGLSEGLQKTFGWFDQPRK